MKSLIAPIVGAGLAVLLAVGVASASTPAPTTSSPVVLAVSTPAPSTAPTTTAGSVLTEILGLSNPEIMALRQQGLSLAQIAERQKVDPQKLIDALVVQWSARIDARLAAGAITADQAKTLKANLAVQAKGMVNQTTLGGMRGAAVGAGPNGVMRGTGAAAGMGAGRGGMMRGAGAGSGACPIASAAPAN